MTGKEKLQAAYAKIEKAAALRSEIEYLQAIADRAKSCNSPTHGITIQATSSNSSVVTISPKTPFLQELTRNSLINNMGKIGAELDRLEGELFKLFNAE